MKKIGVFLFALLIVINISYAQDSFIFQQNEPASLRISCFNETNSLCDSTTNCFITVFKPNSDILLNNVTMTYSGTFYNYSLNSTQTTDQGSHSAVVTCSDDSDGYATFNYLITRSGKEVETGESISYLILTGAIFFLLLISLYFAITIPYANPRNMKGETIEITHFKYIKLGMVIVVYALLTWFLNLLIGISNNFVNLDMFYGLVSFIFNVLVALAWPLLVLFIVWGFFELIRDSNIKKTIKKLGSAVR